MPEFICKSGRALVLGANEKGHHRQLEAFSSINSPSLLFEINADSSIRRSRLPDKSYHNLVPFAHKLGQGRTARYTPSQVQACSTDNSNSPRGK